MARCLKCGRRYEVAHDCPQDERGVAAGPAEDAFPLRLSPPELPGYEITGELGRGGEAVVFAATRTEDGPGPRQVAIKTVPAAARGAVQRLEREAALMSRIGAPAVPAVIALTPAPGVMCLVCERLAPPSLASEMAAAAGPFVETDAAPLVHAILAAVTAVHARGVVHCDLKPENIFLAHAPAPAADPTAPAPAAFTTAHLVDFGIARDIAPDAPDAASTPRAGDDPTATTELATSPVGGTAEYMAPEQCEPGPAIAPIGPGADIYAIGVIIYELLTSRPPFFGAAELVRQAHLSRRPPRPSELAAVSSAMEQVILRCLAKEPTDRFPDVDALAAAFTAALERGIVRERRTTGKYDPVPAPAARRAVPLGLLFFESEKPSTAIRRITDSFAGELAHVAGIRYAIAFGQSVTENPVRRAVQAAQALIGHGLCTRALIDLAAVRVRERKGSRRYISSLFSRADRYPNADDPPGVTLTVDAFDVVPELPAALLGARGGADGADGADEAPARYLLDDEAATEPATVIVHSGTALIGREHDLRELVASARGAFGSRTPTMATAIGDAGVGKSRLGVELLARLRSLVGVVRVVEVRASEPIGGVGQTSQRDLVRQLLSLPFEPPPEGWHPLLADRLGVRLADEIGPGLALAMGWLSPDTPALQRLAAAPSALRVYAVRALGRAIQELAAGGPMCVVLDDAHLADEITLDALEFATLAGGDVPLWVCVLARGDFHAARPAWADRAGGRYALALGELQREDAAVLCRDLLRPAEGVPQKTIEAIVDQTGGTPLLLVELIRGLKREGVVRKHPRGEGWYVASDELGEHADLPLIQWLIERELAELSPDLAAHAGLAACLSGAFFPHELEGVLAALEREGQAHAFPLDAKAGLRRLLDSKLLIAHRDDSVSFRHSLLRDALAERLPAPVRAAVHEAAYHYFSEHPAREHARRARVAYHAERSGLVTEAVALYGELAEDARGRHAYLEAERMYTRALALMDEDDAAERMRALRGRGIMRYRSGRHGDSIEDLGRARAIAETRGETETQIEILLDEAMALDWLQEHNRAVERVEQAAALAGPDAPPRIRAGLLLGRGRSAHRMSRPEESCELLEQCADVAEPLGSECYETLVAALLMLGYIHAMAGRPAPSQRVFASAMALAEEYSDQLHIAAICVNRRTLHILRGDPGGVLRDSRRSLQIGRELGMASIEYINQYNLGEFLYQLDKLDEAWPHVRRALEIEERLFGGAVRPLAPLLAVRLHVYAGEREPALAMLAAIERRQAAARAQGDSETDFVPIEQVMYAAVQRATGAADAGDDEPDRAAVWESLIARASECAAEQELIEVIELFGLWALRRGRPDHARGAFERALEAAASIPNVLADRVRGHLAALPAREAGTQQPG